jgi:predicted 3-demethylubiquinone-9 3-methyltransferase (glyoxalase superfamily)
VHTAPVDYPRGRKGNTIMVEFTLAGQKYVGLNGGPHFKFNEAVSFQIYCDDKRRWTG